MAAKPKVKPGEPKGLLISKLRQAMLESQGNFGEMIRYLIYIYIHVVVVRWEAMRQQNDALHVCGCDLYSWPKNQV